MKQRLAVGPDAGPHSNRFSQPSTRFLNGAQLRPKLQQQQQQPRRVDAQQPPGYLLPHPHHHLTQSHVPTRHQHHPQQTIPNGRHQNPPPGNQPQQQQQPKGASLPLLQHPLPPHHHLMPLRMVDSLVPQCLALSQLEPAPEDKVRTSHAKASVMEKYESLGMVGEGSYGMVLKCRHRESGQLVAIKKFIESEDDKMVKKIAMREIRMLKQLRHENLVNLIEVFRRKKRLYLVFEFMDHTVLDDLDRCPGGLDEDRVRRISFQVLRGIEFCHLHNIIHRDIKPENILVSKSGVVKMCDFGFARSLAKPGEVYTDYVATRWYRAPELLVGDTNYGRAVDIWAIGCLFGELLTAEPLFPGESDIDQLFHIIKCFGNLTARHEEVFHRNPLFERLRLPVVSEVEPLDKKYAHLTPVAVDFMKRCLQLDANDRPTCSQLLKHDFFTMNHFVQKFSRELQTVVQREHRNNPLLGKARPARGDRTPEREAATKAAGLQTHCNSGCEGERNEKTEEEKISHDAGEKPKRKLPDVEKISRSSPVNALSNGLSPTCLTLSQHASWQQDRNSVVQDAESQAIAPNTSTQTAGNSLERLSEKSKSQSKKSNHHTIKKPINFTNTHQSRSTGASQATLPFGQLPDCERFSVATKLKHGNTKGHSTEKHEGKFHLPNVRANETSSPARVAGKTNLSMMSMPQITNSDPMVNETNFKSGSTPVERRSTPEQQLHDRLATGEQRATPEQHATNFPSVLSMN